MCSTGECQQMPGVRWHHSMRPSRHIQGSPACCRVVRLLIDSRAQREADPLNQTAQASYSLIQCFVHTCTQTCILSRDFLTSTRLTLPLPLYSLRVCWCWVACYAPLAACIHPLHSTFRPQIDLVLHLEFATSYSNAQEEGRQGARPREAEGQGTECTSRRWQASVDEEVCQKLR